MHGRTAHEARPVYPWGMEGYIETEQDDLMPKIVSEDVSHSAAIQPQASLSPVTLALAKSDKRPDLPTSLRCSTKR